MFTCGFNRNLFCEVNNIIMQSYHIKDKIKDPMMKTLKNEYDVQRESVFDSNRSSHHFFLFNRVPTILVRNRFFETRAHIVLARYWYYIL
jgi:hypothetical protein